MRCIKISVFLSAMFILSASHQSNATEDSVVYVQILEQDSTGGKTHRAPIFVPIQMYYSENAGSIILNFLNGLGDTEVEQTDPVYGVSCHLIADAQGCCSLGVSGEDGYYRFVISPEYGAKYYAEFWIIDGIFNIS